MTSLTNQPEAPTDVFGPPENSESLQTSLDGTKASASFYFVDNNVPSVLRCSTEHTHKVKG